MTYTVLGYYGKHNNGDEALKLAIQKLLGPKVGEFVCGPVPEGAPVILGGGDVIKPYFLQHLDPKTPVRILGAGLGYESELDMLDPYQIEAAFFRNGADADAARRRGINAHYTPDLAFALDTPTGEKTTPKTMGVMVADNMSLSYGQQDPTQGAYADYLKRELGKFLKEMSNYYRIVFIPMSHSHCAYDIKTIYEIVSSVKPFKFEVLGNSDDAQTNIDLVYQTDVLVTMRFHGIIYATLCGVPFVNIGLTRKTALWCQEAKLSDWSVEPYTFTYQRALDVLKKAEAPEAKARVLQVRSDSKQELEAVKEALQSW